MNCYFCERELGPGAARYGIGAAVDVCSPCGTAVCQEHAGSAPVGEPVLCPIPQHAELWTSRSGVRRAAAVRDRIPPGA